MTSIWFIFTFLILNKIWFGEVMKNQRDGLSEVTLHKILSTAKWMGSVMLYQFDLLQDTSER